MIQFPYVENRADGLWKPCDTVERTDKIVTDPPNALDGWPSTPLQTRGPPNTVLDDPIAKIKNTTGRAEGNSMDDWSPLKDDVLLKGTLLVIVRGRRDGRPQSGNRVVVKGCVFV
jgi:hypothetical protein